MSLDGPRIRGREHRSRSLSPLRRPGEQGLAAVDRRPRRARSSEHRGRTRSSHRRGRSRRRGERSGLQSPDSATTERREKKKGRDGKKKLQSLLRDRSHSAKESRRKKSKKKHRSKSERRAKDEKVSEEQIEHIEQSVDANDDEIFIEERNNPSEREVADVVIEPEQPEEDVVLPVPSPTPRLPRPKQEFSSTMNRGDSDDDEFRDLTGQYRQLMQADNNTAKAFQDLTGEFRQMFRESREPGRLPRPESACVSVRSEGEELMRFQQGQAEEEEEERGESRKMPLPAAEEDQTKLFRFLASPGHQGDDESDSGESQSDAASISGLSRVTIAAAGRPGPWLKPRDERVAHLMEEGGL